MPFFFLLAVVPALLDVPKVLFLFLLAVVPLLLDAAQVLFSLLLAVVPILLDVANMLELVPPSTIALAEPGTPPSPWLVPSSTIEVHQLGSCGGGVVAGLCTNELQPSRTGANHRWWIQVLVHTGVHPQMQAPC